ncbi:MAG: hypothetical protein IJU16_04380 [Clostridia bacterium]|nr:hypothetical protein [Clostridia bacterium]
MFTEEEVDIREIPGDLRMIALDKWRYFIEYPVNIARYLWPVDIVEISDGKMGLVFRKRAFPKMEPLKKLLYSPEQLNWRNESIQRVIRNILLAFDELHSGGYSYHAFDMERMFYNENTGDILIDFSMAMSRHLFDRHHKDWVSAQNICIEFLPPWSKFREDGEFSLEDDYYSLAAMLFRLMIGRMPYQGRLMDGVGDMMDRQRDIDQGMHLIMVEYYHEHPVFIFDETDSSNHIGLYSHEEKIIEKWEDLPKTIQDMFRATFSKENIQNVWHRTLYSARDWMAAFEKADMIFAGRKD